MPRHPFLLILGVLALLFLPARAGYGEDTPGLDRMAGQMIMTGFRGTGLEPSEDLDILLQDIRNGKVGGVIYFDLDHLTKSPIRNIITVGQTGRLSGKLQQEAPAPLFIGIDQEGGRVQRFKMFHGVLPYPSARSLGQGSPETTAGTARRMGEMLRQAGVNLNFAPCLDLDKNPHSPAIGALERSFGPDPQKTTGHATAFAKGLHEAGVIAAYKHFPGHGSAAEDSHLGLTDISATWDESELAPYAAIFREGLPAMVMIGHLRNDALDAELPTSLSHAAVTGLLREKMGWQGVVITDDLQMKAITEQYDRDEVLALAVNAGVDVILLGNNLEHSPTLGRDTHAALVRLVKEGRIPEERIKESYARIMRLKDSLSF